MIRVQLQLDEATHDALSDLARSRRTPMSALARENLGEYLAGHPKNAPASIGDFTFIGSGASGRHDISERHDEALGEDFLSAD